MVDLVLHGGPVFTADAVRSRPTAVAVDAGRIVAVGHDEVLDLAGPGTEHVDLRGRLLVPGFQDAHVHPVWAGLHLLRCDLSELSTAPAYLEAIGSYARAQPRPALGARLRVVDARLSRRDAHRGGARHRRARPAGLPDQRRLPRRLGQLRSPAPCRYRRLHPRPGRRAHRARRRRHPHRHPARGRHAAGRGTGPHAHRRPSCSRPCWWPSTGCTRWGSPAGRTPSSATTATAPTPLSPTAPR